MTTPKVDLELDCKGMNCPLPILKTKKAIDTLQSGQVLRLVATDPGSVKDVDAWSRRTGNPLVASETVDKTYVFYLRKK